MSTKIYVMTHKKFVAPSDTVYQPVFVGSAGKPDVDITYLRDDTGDNISSLNYRYGELTGIYWLWKNLSASADDIIGVCHYRRFFSLEDPGVFCSAADYERMLEGADIITPPSYDAGQSYREYYCEAHNKKELELEESAVEKLFPDDLEVYRRVMDGNTYYYGNLFVTRKKIFDAYCEWLFAILAEVMDRMDFTGYDAYHGRLCGFLSEQLLKVFIEKNKLKTHENRISIVDEKAETKELKAAMALLISRRQISEAYNMYEQVLKVRPDLLLPMSDVLRELPDIGGILASAVLEERNGKDCLVSYSTDMTELIKHYRYIYSAISEGRTGDPDVKAYFEKTKVSAEMLSVIEKDVNTR